MRTPSFQRKASPLIALRGVRGCGAPACRGCPLACWAFQLDHFAGNGVVTLLCSDPPHGVRSILHPAVQVVVLVLAGRRLDCSRSVVDCPWRIGPHSHTDAHVQEPRLSRSHRRQSSQRCHQSSPRHASTIHPGCRIGATGSRQRPLQGKAITSSALRQIK